MTTTPSDLERAEGVVRECGLEMASDDDGGVLPLLLMAYSYGEAGVLTYFTTMPTAEAIAFADITADRLDSGLGTTQPELATTMIAFGHTIGPKLPDGWGFAFAAGMPGPTEALVPFAYCASAEKADVAQVLREFATMMRAAHPHDGHHAAGHG